MKFILVQSVGTRPVGELEVDLSEIQAVNQHYEASVIHLKNGRSFRVQGMLKSLSDLDRLR